MYTWYFTPFFFFNDTATTEIYTLSLHDALPIYRGARGVVRADRDEHRGGAAPRLRRAARRHVHQVRDRKSTRLNSSHGYISYAVFCLKKKKRKRKPPAHRRAQRRAYRTRVQVRA